MPEWSIGVVGCLLVGALGVWLLLGQLGSARQEVLVKATLHTVSQALEAYHEQHRSYVRPGEGGDLASIIPVLVDGGFLAQPPLNPYIGTAYSLADKDRDRIRYLPSADGQSFELRAWNVASDDTWLSVRSR